MISFTNSVALRRALLAATAIPALAAPSFVLADTSGPNVSIQAPQVVLRDGIPIDVPIGAGGAYDINIGPGGVLESKINGIGQMVTDFGADGLGLCTGTLINPRTVIFAAHCVNDAPANGYGAASGGIPISFGFNSRNLAAVRRWVGLDGGTLHATDKAFAIYNAEQVWYDPRSVALGFLEADVALATLDTPATDIPTWTLLFSPLTGETHGVVTGYGAKGTGAAGSNLGIDWRRRSAENMISALVSLNDVDNALFCAEPTACYTDLPQALYQLDFDSPGGEAEFTGGTDGKFDFDVFRGKILPKEGITAGGDSGGPLIVDQKYSKPVVVGVLSGGSRYFDDGNNTVDPLTDQPFSSYGTTSFYQPLFLYWDTIVANNPYVYARSKSGNAEWTDASHWVQAMDPAYAVDRGGKLVNALPGTLGAGKSLTTTRYGEVCFLPTTGGYCVDYAQAGAENSGTGAGLVIPGGPGSTNFVPNNVTANPTTGRKARYYDVTLGGIGTTSLSGAVTVDKLTLDGAVKLDVRGTADRRKAAGALTVLTDFTQVNGWTNVDGLLKTGEALVVNGLLTGGGTFDPTYLTVARGFVSAGDFDTVGTLTIKGDAVFASASTTVFNVNRTAIDKLVVTGDADNLGDVNLGGTALFVKAAGAAVRDRQSFTIVTATGAVTGKYGGAFGPLGILRPELAYNAKDVVVTFKAGNFIDFLKNADATVRAFAGALDLLRSASYNNLSNLYGAVDLMDPAQLSATFAGLSPSRLSGEATSLQETQSKFVLGAIGDRLSMLGSRAPTGRLSVVGSPELMLANAGGYSVSESSAAQNSFASSLSGSVRTIGKLPEGMSGFIASGFSSAPGLSFASTGPNQGQRSWHMAMGLEMPVTERATLGTAFGHSTGRARLSGDLTQVKTDTAAAYGSYQLGGGVYGAGLAAVAFSRSDFERRASGGTDALSLRGARTATAIDLRGEAGVNLDVARGLTLTPRVAVTWSSMTMGGYQETGGQTALRLQQHRLERTEARLGARLSGNVTPVRGWALIPEVQADFVSNLSGDWNGLRVSFAEAPELAFDLPGIARDRAWGEVKAGLQLTDGALSFGGGLQTAVGRSDYRDDRAVASIGWRF